MAKRLTYAMVGGGPDGFIGDAHRRAIGLDGTAAIAAGVFSRNREKSLQMAESLGISPDRCYEDYQTMARAEGEREDGVDFVTVVTPNQSHYEICRAFLEAGIHVVCDKPVTTTYRQAKELEALAEDKGLLFMVTYTYMGYVTAKYARELVASGFEYFAGGGLLKPTGSDGKREDLYALAEKAGYTVVKTQAEAEKVTSGPVILIDEHLADSSAMAYDLDRTENMWSLADYVKKGIQVLDNDDTGFFLMCEGGKIDWACHANDAASTIHDTLALADAVQIAIDFAEEHADETLILVTGDHETGGLTIGFAGTDYDTYLSLLDSQKISFAKYDSDYVSAYKENKADFETVLADVEELFGLKASGDASDKLVLTDYELGLLKNAYEKSVNERDTGMAVQAEYVAYGTYEPLSVTITHILNNKSGVAFTSYSHTGLPVAMFASGVNAEQFGGYYDNTEIYNKLAEILAVK